MSVAISDKSDEEVSYNIIVERVVGDSVEDTLSVEGYGVFQEALDDILKMIYEKDWC